MFRELIRKHQQLTEQECIDILKETTRGVLSVLGDDDYPYGTPMNHWYNEQDGCIYFHCGNEGHRLDSLQRHNKVSFCTYAQQNRVENHWAWKVNSVIVFGKMEVITEKDLVIDYTTQLSYKFTQDDAYIQREIKGFLDKTLLLKLIPEHICGKRVTEN